MLLHLFYRSILQLLPSFFSHASGRALGMATSFTFSVYHCDREWREYWIEVLDGFPWNLVQTLMFHTRWIEWLDEPLTAYLVPSSCQNFKVSSTFVYDHKPAKLMTSQSVLCVVCTYSHYCGKTVFERASSIIVYVSFRDGPTVQICWTLNRAALTFVVTVNHCWPLLERRDGQITTCVFEFPVGQTINWSHIDTRQKRYSLGKILACRCTNQVCYIGKRSGGVI